MYKEATKCMRRASGKLRHVKINVSRYSPKHVFDVFKYNCKLVRALFVHHRTSKYEALSIHFESSKRGFCKRYHHLLKIRMDS